MHTVVEIVLDVLKILAGIAIVCGISVLALVIVTSSGMSIPWLSDIQTIDVQTVLYSIGLLCSLVGLIVALSTD